MNECKPLLLGDYAHKVDAFKQQHIYPHMGAQEKEEVGPYVLSPMKAGKVTSEFTS